MSLPTKSDYNEFIKTTGMFYVDAELEAAIEQEVKLATDTLWSRMKGIATTDGLKQFIKDDPEALENLISLMNVSSEKFKRVITTLRLEKGHAITGEWDLSKIRAMMIERPSFMDEVCDLLSNGANNPKYQKQPLICLPGLTSGTMTYARLPSALSI